MRHAGAWVVLVWLALIGTARADQPARWYVLAIGYNGLPAATSDPRMHELRYADDDAAAFAQLAHDLGARAFVLSSFDADTERRFPGLSGQVRPPLFEELRRTVRDLNAAFEEDRKLSIEPIVLITYSGHGVAEPGAPPALTLADGPLTQEVLYTEVLSALKARFVHVIVDACHAAAVVRPRDVQADTVVLSPDEIDAQWARTTLDGLANVGALVASSASAQSHEWDNWQHGVFTHEVLSGLRGAADVNGDRRIEYSEMAAFLGAANSEVADRAARVKPLIKAPRAAARAPIVALDGARKPGFLVGRPGMLGAIWVEASDGQRIADLSSEQAHTVRLLVPSERRLFVRSASGEVEVRVAAGGAVDFADLTLQAHTSRDKGSVDLSLERGLFAAPFGPAYYRGFVDSASDWVAVPLGTERGTPAMTASDNDGRTVRALGWSALGVSGALLVTSAVFGVMTLDAKSDFDAANGLELQSRRAADRFETYRAASIGTLIGGVLSGFASYLLFAAE
jgi:hypothetical protein